MVLLLLLSDFRIMWAFFFAFLISFGPAKEVSQTNCSSHLPHTHIPFDSTNSLFNPTKRWCCTGGYTTTNVINVMLYMRNDYSCQIQRNLRFSAKKQRVPNDWNGMPESVRLCVCGVRTVESLQSHFYFRFASQSSGGWLPVLYTRCVRGLLFFCAIRVALVHFSCSCGILRQVSFQFCLLNRCVRNVYTVYTISNSRKRSAWFYFRSINFLFVTSGMRRSVES